MNLPDRERWHVISTIRLIPWRMINVTEGFADDGDHRLFPERQRLKGRVIDLKVEADGDLHVVLVSPSLRARACARGVAS